MQYVLFFLHDHVVDVYQYSVLVYSYLWCMSDLLVKWINIDRPKIADYYLLDRIKGLGYFVV